MAADPLPALERWLLGLAAAAAAACVLTVELAWGLPTLRHASLAALPLMIVVAIGSTGILAGGAVLLGFISALLCLAPLLLVAMLCRSRLAGYVLAGGLAGALFTVLGALTHLADHPSALLWFWRMGLVLIPDHPTIQNTLGVGLAATGAGVVAGTLFAVIVRAGDVAMPWRLVLLVLLLAAMASWLAAHDPDDNQICPHSETVRLAVGPTLYSLPAALQFRVTAQPGQKPLHIFRRFDHPGSRAEAQAARRVTYCQTPGDAPWIVRGFDADRLIQNVPLPEGVMSLSISRDESGRYFNLSPVMVPLPPDDKNLGWISAQNGAAPFWPEREEIGHHRPTGKGWIKVRLADGSWLLAKLRFDETEPLAGLAELRGIGGFLAAHATPIRP